ncbi:MAG TPA: DNA-directed RNA polymerase subunit alpha [Firmicutes bacterium]|nr:DNA-directed RNA polymerase subunit alpha [Bacillota bacterium]
MMELPTNGFFNQVDAFNSLAMAKEPSDDGNVCAFTFEPLPRGFGVTLGNAMRRTILSSIVGCCITYVKIEGLPHEYMAIEGVLEDSIELLLNIRRTKVNLLGPENSQVIRLSVSGERVVTAADFVANPEVEIINPDQVICTLTGKDSKLDIEAVITRGSGFKTAAELKRKDSPIGVITLDCNYSPVERVAYQVENTRVGSATDYEKLILTIETNGTKSADAVLGEGAAELKRYLNWITDKQSAMMSYIPQEEPVDAELQAKLEMSVEDLGLSGRAANCLRNAQVKSVGELVEYSPEQLMGFKNFGEKSLIEIVDKLAEMDLFLKETE